ncbi:hypothetical protein IWZ03DRAFT_343601 [Phyllosticta citriasiana]|uniref:C2H2-type domain-containing protein n=1 Tax=Phyllosticta citriasiana TaxID=595635 RepID=A0ABR1KRD6_9PEZI
MTFPYFDEFSAMALQPDSHLTESYPWPGHDTQWNGVRLSSKTISLLSPDSALDSASSQNLSNMQRYLSGPERPLFSADVFPLHGSRREHGTRSYHLDSQYDAVGPWHYPDQIVGKRSPDYHRSSWSASSSSSYNHSLQDEPSVATFSSSDPSSPLGMASQDYVECRPFSTYQPDDSISGSCALREVQQYPSPSEDAEQQMENDDSSDIKYEFTYEQEAPYYPSRVENGDHHYSQVPEHDEDLQVRMRDAESVQPVSKSEEDPDSDYTPSASGPKRRPRRASQSNKYPRRPSSARKSMDMGNRVSKKPKGSRFIKDSSAARPFPCPLAGYSCQATFASKNEWKRHVSTQHIRLGFWRCELCPNTIDGITTSYNDFNRKDLFAQHLRRMHYVNSSAGHAVPRGPSRDHPVTDENMAEYLRRCYIKLRDAPPKSSCLFCCQTFEGTGSWDERMEHVGRHFEKDKKPECTIYGVDTWREDEELRDWLCSEGLVECDHRGVWQLGDGTPRRRKGHFAADDDDSDDDDDNDGDD